MLSDPEVFIPIFLQFLPKKGSPSTIIILVSLNVDVANGFGGIKLQCLYDNVIFKTKTCRCRHGVNKAKNQNEFIRKM